MTKAKSAVACAVTIAVHPLTDSHSTVSHSLNKLTWPLKTILHDVPSCAALREALQDFKELEVSSFNTKCKIFLKSILTTVVLRSAANVPQVQWDAFLQRLDDELQLSPKIHNVDHQSKCISPDTPLIDARTGEWVWWKSLMLPHLLKKRNNEPHISASFYVSLVLSALHLYILLRLCVWQNSNAAEISWER